MATNENMGGFKEKPLFIFVSGPYSPPDAEDPSIKKELISKNVEKANEIALEIAKKGHYPFVPHTMMKNWEDEYNITRVKEQEICHKWLEKCDALYFIASSEGAELERKRAYELNLQVFYMLDDIPNIEGISMNLSKEALSAYLVEYHECMESYRHTYQTIWSAGGIFAAVSAAMVTLATNIYVLIFSPVPLIFWYLGIFIPMNRYGELRNNRLKKIEEILNDKIPDLNMHHFISYSERNDKTDFLKRIYERKWGVHHLVTIFGITLIILQIYLIWRYSSLLKLFF